MIDNYLKAYSRLENFANKTPVLTSRTLNFKLKSEVFFKCENFQRAGAFKFRGAFNTINQLSIKEKENGIITHSSGNHAQAVSLVSKILKVKSVIVMPDNAPQVKVKATRDYGAEIHFCESTIDAREKLCSELIQDNGFTLIHPYDNINVIYGAGTAAMELINQIGELDYILAPIGGGGLISGTAAYSKESGKVGIVIGAEPENANDAYNSFKSNNLVTHHKPNTIADGLRTLLSPLTFDFIRRFVDDIIIVKEDEIIEAMKFLWERMKIIVEPSGAVPLAAIIKGIEQGVMTKNTRIGLILSGGNIDLSNFFKIYKKKNP